MKWLKMKWFMSTLSLAIILHQNNSAKGTFFIFFSLGCFWLHALLHWPDDSLEESNFRRILMHPVLLLVSPKIWFLQMYHVCVHTCVIFMLWRLHACFDKIRPLTQSNQPFYTVFCINTGLILSIANLQFHLSQ